MGSRARYRDAEYEVVNFTDRAEWVLRDADGDMLVFEEDRPGEVQVACELCGNWAYSPMIAKTGRWLCAEKDCYDAKEGDR
jgi:hypothetical protein